MTEPQRGVQDQAGLPDVGSLPGLILDPGSWQSWDGPPDQPPHDEEYGRALVRATMKSGHDEAVSTGEGTIGGQPTAVMLGNFGFLGGSIGQAAASRLARCAERATLRRMPLLAFPASGGTRMQEGAPGFAAALAVAAAVARHRDAGLPYLVYLRNPTFGGVLATWAALGCPVLAEPGAAVGFLGPRPYAALGGAGDPRPAQTAENLAAHDLVDAVVPPAELRGVLSRLLDVLCPGPGGAPDSSPAGQPAGYAGPVLAPAVHSSPSPTALAPAALAPARTAPGPVGPPGADAWESVARSRRPDRPGLRQALGADAVIWLTGAAAAGSGGSPLVVAAARLGGQRCVIVGQDRSALAARPLGPAALRRAQRAMRLAEDLAIPLVTVIDTTGAELSPAAEEGGVAFEIARCVAAMLRLRVPTVAVLLGQGTGGGALALAAADRLIALEHSWLAPLAPEGASAIMHGYPQRAAELARAQRIGAADLLNQGIADLILPEPGSFDGGLGAAVAGVLGTLSGQDSRTLAERRYRRFRRLAELPPEAPASRVEYQAAGDGHDSHRSARCGTGSAPAPDLRHPRGSGGGGAHRQ